MAQPSFYSSGCTCGCAGRPAPGTPPPPLSSAYPSVTLRSHRPSLDCSDTSSVTCPADQQEKMTAEGLPDAAIKAFEYSFNLLASGESGMIPEADIAVSFGRTRTNHPTEPATTTTRPDSPHCYAPRLTPTCNTTTTITLLVGVDLSRLLTCRTSRISRPRTVVSTVPAFSRCVASGARSRRASRRPGGRAFKGQIRWGRRQSGRLWSRRRRC